MNTDTLFQRVVRNESVVELERLGEVKDLARNKVVTSISPEVKEKLVKLSFGEVLS